MGRDRASVIRGGAEPPGGRACGADAVNGPQEDVIAPYERLGFTAVASWDGREGPVCGERAV